MAKHEKKTAKDSGGSFEHYKHRASVVIDQARMSWDAETENAERYQRRSQVYVTIILAIASVAGFSTKMLGQAVLVDDTVSVDAGQIPSRLLVSAGTIVAGLSVLFLFPFYKRHRWGDEPFAFHCMLIVLSFLWAHFAHNTIPLLTSLSLGMAGLGIVLLMVSLHFLVPAKSTKERAPADMVHPLSVMNGTTQTESIDESASQVTASTKLHLSLSQMMDAYKWMDHECFASLSSKVLSAEDLVYRNAVVALAIRSGRKYLFYGIFCLLISVSLMATIGLAASHKTAAGSSNAVVEPAKDVGEM